LCLEFTILTVVRENEALGARKNEVDPDAAVWIVPKERVKRVKGQPRREHRVPLSARALEIVRGRMEMTQDDDGLLFPGAQGRQMSNATMDRVLDRMGVDATVHGFRSTFKDWAEDCTSFPDSLSEEALSHKVGDDVRQAYRRGDALEKRRKL
jgi:integrase